MVDAPAVPTKASTLLSTLWQQLVANAKADAAAPIIAVANNIIATPDGQEAVLQGPQLLTALFAIGPHLEAQEFVSLATVIKTWASTVGTPATPPAA